MNVPSARSKQASVDNKVHEKIWEEQPEPSPYDDRRYVAPSEMRPQRMPLPIAGAQTMPDSPSIGPIDPDDHEMPFIEDKPIEPEDYALHRKSSVMSLGSQDGEDVDDELPPADPAAGTVQTVIEWTRPGKKVYVTGTFANWEKKFKMHQM
jgi:hypothetical protein